MQSDDHAESAVDYCNRMKVLLLLERMADHVLTDRPAEPIGAMVQFLKIHEQRMTLSSKEWGDSGV